MEGLRFKDTFFLGMIILGLSIGANFYLHQISSIPNSGKSQEVQLQKLLRATDHLYTAVYYLEEKKGADLVRKELDAARVELRDPALIRVRKP